MALFPSLSPSVWAASSPIVSSWQKSPNSPYTTTPTPNTTTTTTNAAFLTPLCLQEPHPRKHNEVVHAMSSDENWAALLSASRRACDALLRKLALPIPNGRTHKEEALEVVSQLLRTSLGARMFVHGSYLARTALAPSTDTTSAHVADQPPIDVCAFFTALPNNNTLIPSEHSWTQRLVEAALVCPQVESVTLLRCAMAGSGTQVELRVNRQPVLVAVNQRRQLQRSALLLEADQAFGGTALLRRSILLFKSFCRRDLKLSAHDLSSASIDVIMLTLFNVHEPMPRSPLHALYAVVTWLASIDFSNMAIGIEGLVPRRRESDACQTSAMRLSAELLQRCEVGASATQTALAGDIVILDPFDHHHNLCALKPSSAVLAAFVGADQRIRHLKTRWFRQGDTAMALLSESLKSVEGREVDDACQDDEEWARRFEVDIEEVQLQIRQADSFRVPDMDEAELVQLLEGVLREQAYASCSVGKLGTLVHARTNAHGLPSLLKARYGGLKKLLERHASVFSLGTDHPYNPVVVLHNDKRSSSASSNGSTETSGRSKGRGTSNSSSPTRRRRSHRVRSRRGSGSQWLGQTLCCPISGAPFIDAVVASDGFTFERSSLELWTRENGQVSPVTGERLTGVLLPNRTLTNLANIWRHLQNPQGNGGASQRKSL